MAYHAKGVLFVASALGALWNGWELTGAVPVYFGWVHGGGSVSLARLLLHTLSFVIFSGFAVRYWLLLRKEDGDEEHQIPNR